MYSVFGVQFKSVNYFIQDVKVISVTCLNGSIYKHNKFTISGGNQHFFVIYMSVVYVWAYFIKYLVVCIVFFISFEVK